MRPSISCTDGLYSVDTTIQRQSGWLFQPILDISCCPLGSSSQIPRKKYSLNALPTGKHQVFVGAQNSNFPNFLRFTWDHHVIHCRSPRIGLVIAVWQIPSAPEWRSRNPTQRRMGRSWVNAWDAPKKRRVFAIGNGEKRWIDL